MLFNNLSSEVIKAGLISRRQFSLGYSMISKHIQAQLPLKIDMETGVEDRTPQVNSGKAQQVWRNFQDYCQTNDYQTSSLEEIIAAYINGTNRPIQGTPDAVLALRAKVSGENAKKLKEKADHETAIKKAKLAEKLQALSLELSDCEATANRWYGEDSTIEDIELIPDTWVIETYPKIVKTQVAYWTRFNNWDDAELVMIDADNALLATVTA